MVQNLVVGNQKLGARLGNCVSNRFIWQPITSLAAQSHTRMTQFDNGARINGESAGSATLPSRNVVRLGWTLDNENRTSEYDDRSNDNVR